MEPAPSASEPVDELATAPQFRPLTPPPEPAAPAAEESVAEAEAPAHFRPMESPPAPEPAPVAQPPSPPQFRPQVPRASDAAPATPAAEPVPAELGAKEHWQAAREAYWRRDLDRAIEHYEALVRLEPEDPRAQGELGNLYYQLGRWQEAAVAYEAAAHAMLRQGNHRGAENLLRVLRGLDSERAAQLEALL
jgi:tetratricopeptide (TPR) repeat protein